MLLAWHCPLPARRPAAARHRSAFTREYERPNRCGSQTATEHRDDNFARHEVVRICKCYVTQLDIGTSHQWPTVRRGDAWPAVSQEVEASVELISGTEASEARPTVKRPWGEVRAERETDFLQLPA